MTSADPARLRVRSPGDLIAAVPYLLGFHPADSLVVVGLRDSRLVFAARYDLPPPDEPPETAAAQARHVAAVVARQGVNAATTIGYGPAVRVTPAVPRLAGALRAAGLTVLDELRVTDGRYWSYACPEPSCCPAEGVPCDPAGSAVTATAVFAGQVALPDRAALVDRVAPVTGPQRAAMRAATAAAERELVALVEADVSGAGAGVLRAGTAAVRAAMRRHRAGDRLGDDEVAWLGVLLTDLPVRDRAWELIDADDRHVDLWIDVLRRVEPPYVPAPASLLGFAAWRAGQGALASIALDRARSADPAYSMAVLLEEVLQHGLPPSALDGWPVFEPAPRRRQRRRPGRGKGGAGERRVRA